MGNLDYMNLGIKPFRKGLCDLGNNSYAYLQPDGGWGWSNAGVVCDGDESLIIDTLFDENLTFEMLNAMKDAQPKALNQVIALVNTHSNGDHCNGNNCVNTDEIISSEAALEEMKHESPEMMANLLLQAPSMGSLGKYFLDCFGSFDFKGVTQKLPNTTFRKETSRRVGDKTVRLFEVGPAHTNGDVIAYVPEDKIVFTGDILFIEGHPILWAGPVSNWLDACDMILSLEVDSVVPGHGPVTDKRGVKAVREYLHYIHSEAKSRYDSGMSALDACHDIDFSFFSSWGDSERIAVNINSLYREFKGEKQREDINLLFQQMSELKKTDTNEDS